MCLTAAPLEVQLGGLQRKSAKTKAEDMKLENNLTHTHRNTHVENMKACPADLWCTAQHLFTKLQLTSQLQMQENTFVNLFTTYNFITTSPPKMTTCECFLLLQLLTTSLLHSYYHTTTSNKDMY